MTHIFHPTMLREYDIRGVVGDTLSDKDAYAIGRSFATLIRRAGGRRIAIGYDGRLSSPMLADALIADLNTRFGGIDVIIANAGIAHRVPMAQMTDAKWDETFDIDLKGMLRVIRPALPAMKPGASIICLSSIMGVSYGWDEHVHYSAAKAGVIGMIRGLAVEFAARGIRVNGVAPGYIRTAQLLNPGHSLGPDAAEIASPYIPMRRLGDPEQDLRGPLLFLASDASSYTTGVSLNVDGGFLS